MNSKAGIFIEYLWLVIAIFSLIAGIHQWYHTSIENSSMFFVMLFISLLMFTFRRQMRKKSKTQEK